LFPDKFGVRFFVFHGSIQSWEWTVPMGSGSSIDS
jgi:hypothetical protein